MLEDWRKPLRTKDKPRSRKCTSRLSFCVLRHMHKTHTLTFSLLRKLCSAAWQRTGNMMFLGKIPINKWTVSCLWYIIFIINSERICKIGFVQ